MEGRRCEVCDNGHRYRVSEVWKASGVAPCPICAVHAALRKRQRNARASFRKAKALNKRRIS